MCVCVRRWSPHPNVDITSSSLISWDTAHLPLEWVIFYIYLCPLLATQVGLHSTARRSPQVKPITGFSGIILSINYILVWSRRRRVLKFTCIVKSDMFAIVRAFVAQGVAETFFVRTIVRMLVGTTSSSSQEIFSTRRIVVCCFIFLCDQIFLKHTVILTFLQ